MTQAQDRQDLPRTLRLFDTTTTVVGAIIGTGIFLKARYIAQLLPDPNVVVLLWVVAGALSLFGALVISELGAMYPRSGGLYVYLTEAFGPMVGFLFGWSMLSIMQTGSLAGIAAGIMENATALYPFTPWEQIAGAVDLILIFTLINCISVRATAGVQNFLTVLKSVVLVVLVAGALLPGRGAASNWAAAAPNLQHALGAAFGLAMIKALWVYDGWIDVSFVAGEVREPRRNLPRAIVTGMAFIIVIYVAVNACYHFLMPVSQIQGTKSVAAEAAGVIAGPKGVVVMSVAILLSSVGGLNTSLMTGGRVYFAMARERLFFPSVGAIHGRFLTPHVSLVVQAVWSIVLLLFWGTFDRITDNVIFCYWIFYALGGIAVIVLRRRLPDVERPYRCPGYPFIPLVFITLALALILNTIKESPGDALQGIFLLVSGALVYPFFSRFHRRGPG